jgi:probable addiction module antidote protein
VGVIKAARAVTLSVLKSLQVIGVQTMTDDLKLYSYDPAEALTSPEAIAEFMNDAFASGDAGYIAKALGVVARARGMTDLARETGLSREQLYRSFSEEGNPTLKTLLAVMQVLGLDIMAQPHAVA